MCPCGIEVALFSHPGDFDGHFEQGMSHLACHHIDFVRLRYGDDHVRVGNTGAFQYVGPRCVTDHSLRIEIIVDPAISSGDVSITTTSLPSNVRCRAILKPT